jgi:hypothetical protein
MSALAGAARSALLRRTSPADANLQQAANEQSCSALAIGMSETHCSGIPGSSLVERPPDPDFLGDAENSQRRTNMLWTIFVVLGILWLLGFSLHVGGGLIHILLVVALVVLVINLLSGRRGIA